MPKNTTILLIRHAEKPDSGTGLAVPGQERAAAYSIYFQNYTLSPDTDPIKLNYLFAAADSSDSDRPRLTITPLSKAIGKAIDNKYKDKDYQKAADDLLHHPKYDNSNILICWHHSEILKLADALGANPGQLPPEPWPGDVFGWVLQLTYDDAGAVTQTQCFNEQLMYDDYGNVPPTTG